MKAQSIDATAPQITRTGTYALIGTDPNGTPVSWRLSDPHGRPAHGLVTGWAGAGATVLLSQIITAATQAHITTWFLDAKAARNDAHWHTGDLEEFMGALEEVMLHRSTEDSADPLLVVIDDPCALESYGPVLQVMAGMGQYVGVGFVVRAMDLSQLRLPSALRAVLASSQYLVFDHGAHHPLTRHLAAFLPAYTAPARGPRPGRHPACGKGRYGRDSSCGPVTVRFP